MSAWRSQVTRGSIGALAGVAACLALASAAGAQQVQPRSPRIGYAYPAGGRQGTTFQVTIGGQFLDGVSRLRILGAGVHVKSLELKKPMPPQEANALRDKLKELVSRDPAAFPRVAERLEKAEVKRQEKKGDAPKPPQAASTPEAAAGKPGEAQRPAPPVPLTPEEQKLVVEIREKLANAVIRPANPAIGETVVVELTIDKDAVLGDREIRLETALGVTNPLVFCVGSLPESSDPAAKVRSDLGPVARQRVPGRPEPEVKGERTVSLPAVVNGQILPGEVDRIRFAARRGQSLVIVATARRLIPYLADAVPGWFQATLALYDAQGHEVAYDDDFRFDPDPVLHYAIPADGDYVVEIKDAVFRGREDFVYRLTIGELPFVTNLFPLGGKVGEKTTTEVRGWNLSTSKVKVDLSHAKPGLAAVSLGEAQRFFNRVPFAADTLPERGEREKNDDERQAQRVSLPVIVNGRIDRPGDQDVFRIEGRAGQKIVAEVLARRLGSPLDSMLRLTDAAGKELAANDDYEDKGAGLETHHADSLLSATLPADGPYFIHLSDVQGKGGDDYAYRLRLSQPRPDFDLRIVPSSINTRPGTTLPITIYALRRDGFSEAIHLELKDAPDGFVLSGGAVPAGQDKVRFTLTIPPGPQDQPVALRLEGRAVIQGKEVRHLATPADDMMQAFAYHHLVPAQEWLVDLPSPPSAPRPAVAANVASPPRPADGRGLGPAGRPPGPAANAARRRVELLEEKPVQLQPGGTAQVHFAVPRGPLASQAQIELDEGPEGIAVREVATRGEQLVVVLQADAEKVKPGLAGNLIFNAFVERDAPAGQPQVGKRRVPLGHLPAAPFEVTSR